MSTYEISKSSLLSLKAEILKKQDEVNKAKLENKARIPQSTKKGPLDIKNKGVEKRKENDNTEEDEDLLRKSKSVLEAKARLYEKLANGMNIDEDRKRNFLVHFDKKVEMNKADESMPNFDDEPDDKRPESEDEMPVNYDDYRAENSDDEWVEYTDCLGRTRTCLKKDLAHIKEKDSNLRSTVDSRNAEKIEEDPKENVSEKSMNEKDFDEESEMLSSDMRRELLRQQWEKEEEELRNKTNVHYQDILFGEARTHGVGYYGFSKDEEERARQQAALKNLRKETEEQQKLAQQMKLNRDKQLAARIRAAKNRKRAKLGLPPLTSDDEEEKIEEPEAPEPVVTPEPSEEEIIKKKNEEMRNRHTRPWDIGKEGVKEHYELSQEEWVNLQRKKRDNDFAPPRSYHSTEKPFDIAPEEKKGLYFSSSRKRKQQEFEVDTSKPPPDVRNPSKKHLNPYKTKENVQILENKTFESRPIEDEIIHEGDDDEDDESDRLMQDFRQIKSESKSGVEIPPPPTYEYYGPSSSKNSKVDKPKENMEDAIMQGLKFFRQKIEKKNTTPTAYERYNMD